MKKWSKDNPKAALMEQKRTAIVTAARQWFLENGYSHASMDAIAKSAEVSVKTIYRYFKDKDELFSAVMHAVCVTNGVPAEQRNEESLAARFSWFRDTSKRGLTEAATEYLRHLLSEEQLALYRVVIQDSHRFPELGRSYQREVASGRKEIVGIYIRRSARINKWKFKDPGHVSDVFEALLRKDLFEEVLQGLRPANERTMNQQARSVADAMWELIASGVF
jgi:AcrR family transcriptional regulator